jgi:hypothetical protein
MRAKHEEHTSTIQNMIQLWLEAGAGLKGISFMVRI